MTAINSRVSRYSRSELGLGPDQVASHLENATEAAESSGILRVDRQSLSESGLSSGQFDTFLKNTAEAAESSGTPRVDRQSLSELGLASVKSPLSSRFWPRLQRTFAASDVRLASSPSIFSS
jgi:hypothetical protein